MNVTCPTCGKTSVWSQDNPYRPFCRERCRLIDLGKWADGTQRIPGKELSADEVEDDDTQLEKPK